MSSTERPLKVHPTFGNLVVEERAASVALRLSYDPLGSQTAVFTYREIAMLADMLGRIKPPASPEPISCGVFD